MSKEKPLKGTRAVRIPAIFTIGDICKVIETIEAATKKGQRVHPSGCLRIVLNQYGELTTQQLEKMRGFFVDGASQDYPHDVLREHRSCIRIIDKRLDQEEHTPKGAIFN